ncbi:MAG TPA: DMT family transporter [Solirubrobacterales bacterium]
MSILAALASALCLGTGDFLGGVASRRTSPLAIALWANLVALSVLAVACLLARPGLSGDAALGAVFGGILTATGMTLIYAALAGASISLAAPLIAVGSALLPTLAATISGQAPDAPQGAGIVVSLVGVVAITWVPPSAPQAATMTRRGLILAALASLTSGAAVSFLLLASKGDAGQALAVSGLSRLTATAACLLLVVVSRPAVMPPRSGAPGIAAIGLLDVAGVTLYLFASSVGNTSVVAVLLSLYAVVSVLLAQEVLGERIARQQGWGILAAAVGVALLSAG